MSSVKRVLVYGGKGALGSACVTFFKAKNWWVGCVDLNSCSHSDVSVTIDGNEDSWQLQSQHVISVVDEALAGNQLDAILCVAGGWAGGSASSKNVIKNSEMMWRQSVWSSLICSQLATRYLKPSGLLQLTGAQAALHPTPGMLGYGMAKSAVHQLTRSLAATPAAGCGHVLAILPVTLDTAGNRASMPTADTAAWTPLQYVAQLLYDWSDNEGTRPESGSLVQLITKDGVTSTLIE